MRKITFIICAAILSSGVAFSQQKSSKKKKVVAEKIEAPAVVKDAFMQNTTQYVGMSEPVWHKTASGNWIAKFELDSVKTAIEYNTEGTWIATRSEYAAAHVPGSVLETLKNKYPSAVVKDGWKIERADVASYYKISIDDNGAPKTVLLNDAGTIVE